jgi:hypothetical protein
MATTKTEPTGPATIAEALAAAQAELTDPPKDSVNPHFKSRYADLATVLKTVRPVLARHGIALVQTTDILDGVTVLVTRLLWRDEEILGRYPMQPTKADPQGLGSAMTYARRYALQAIVGVAADDDDDDGNAASAPKPSAPRVEDTAALTAKIAACVDIEELRAMRSAVAAAGATATAAWKARGEFLKAASEAP